MRLPAPSIAAPARLRRRTEHGFSFLEVLMAMSMLLVGSVAILSLFAIGAHHMVQRKIDARLAQVRPEVHALVQDTLDQQKAGALPSRINERPLSRRGFSVDVEYRQSPFGGPRYEAHAVIRFQGTPVRVLPPLYLTRSTLDPR